MTPKDFEVDDDGEDLVADGFWQDAVVVSACISVCILMLFIVLVWR